MSRTVIAQRSGGDQPEPLREAGPGVNRPAWSRYLAAVLIVAGATGLRVGLHALLGARAPYLTFYPAVMLAALWGGLGPGLLATVLSGIAASCWLEPFGVPFRILDPADQLSLGVFTMSCTIISCACEAMHRAQARATQAEAQVRLAEERLKAEEVMRLTQFAMEHAADGIYWIAPDARFIAVNEAACRTLGYTREELLRLSVPDIDPDFPLSVWQGAWTELKTRGILHVESRHRARDGRMIPVDVAANYLDFGGKEYNCCFVRDISERKQAEEALRQSRELLRAIVEGTSDAVYVKDPAGRYMLFNAAAGRFTGKRPEDVLGQDDTFLFPLKEAQAVMAGDRAVMDGGRTETYEEYVTDAAGRHVTFLSTKGPLYDEHGSLTGLFGIARDITEFKAAEVRLLRLNEDLLASQERLHLAQSFGRVGTFEYDLRAAVNHWSPELEALYGLPPGRFGGRYEDWAALVHPEDRPGVEQRLREELEQDVCEDEFRVIWPDGTVHWLAARSSVLKDASGKPLRLVGVNFDITERKRAEESLHEANRQLSEADRRKNEFLAMLAHELRNPLAPMRSAVQVLRLVAPKDPTVQRQQDIIDRQVTHMARLLGDLLDSSRVTRGIVELQCQPLDLSIVLAHAVETTTPLIEARRHTLSVALPPEGVLVNADLDRLAQIVGNLLANAAKYTDVGGRIWLEAAREGAEAVVRVRDSGVGIAPEMLPRVFDLFTQADRSLARSQGGLGIGLTMTKKLVEMHGGTVEAHSAGLGLGSEFIVRLPALSGQAPAPIEKPREPAPEVMPRRILVVDDIADTSASLAELLSAWGHEVAVALDGRTALELAGQFRPEVVLLDIGMPGIDGYEVARRLRRDYDGRLLLVALTGYAQESDRAAARAAGFDRHMEKPVDLEALRELLTQPAA